MSTSSSVERSPHGFKRILDSKNGALQDVELTQWGGILAMLLRKIAIDNYDGKGKEGVDQQVDEKLTLYEMEEMISGLLTRFYGDKLSAAELNTKKNMLLKELSRGRLTMKYFGDFLQLLDPEWVDITIVINRKSGTTKSYTAHVGGIGTSTYEKPNYNQDHFDKYGTHDESNTIERPTYQTGKKGD